MSVNSGQQSGREAELQHRLDGLKLTGVGYGLPPLQTVELCLWCAVLCGVVWCCCCVVCGVVVSCGMVLLLCGARLMSYLLTKL